VKIHPSAIVNSEAELGTDVEIGPYCIVDSGVQIADRCRLVAHVNIRSGTALGCDSVVYEGAVLGGLPQHINNSQPPGDIVIGERNVLREHVTVHRAMHQGEETRIGNDCLLMVGSHVAHDCQVGDRVILTNGTMLGGHVEIGNRACLGGNVAVHQFCRIGRLSMVGGCTKVVQDVPPFVLTDGATALVIGLNSVGLRRAGLDRQQILDLKAAYRLIYRKGLAFRETLAALEQEFPQGVAAEFAEFFQGGQRGFVQERRRPPHTALRIHPAIEEEIDESSETPVEIPVEISPRRMAG